MSDELFSFDIDGFQAEIQRLVSDLDGMGRDADQGALQAMQEAAEMIASEQKRLLAAAPFRERTTDLSALIKVVRSDTKKYKRLRIGYDSEAIKQHPEVLVVEFGRPGKSARRMKPTDSLGRKKGEFPPQTPHITAGFFLAKEKAAAHFREKMMEIVQRRWNNGG